MRGSALTSAQPANPRPEVLVQWGMGVSAGIQARPLRTSHSRHGRARARTASGTATSASRPEPRSRGVPPCGFPGPHTQSTQNDSRRAQRKSSVHNFHVLRKCTNLCWAGLRAVLGRVWALGCRLDTLASRFLCPTQPWPLVRSLVTENGAISRLWGRRMDTELQLVAAEGEMGTSGPVLLTPVQPRKMSPHSA